MSARLFGGAGADLRGDLTGGGGDFETMICPPCVASKCTEFEGIPRCGGGGGTGSFEEIVNGLKRRSGWSVNGFWLKGFRSGIK